MRNPQITMYKYNYYKNYLRVGDRGITKSTAYRYGIHRPNISAQVYKYIISNSFL